MREIKFRTFIKESKRMIYGISAMAVKMFTPNYAYLNSEVEVMQYTGLKDKNGKEIYESDIILTIKPGEHVPNRDSGGGIIDYDFIEPEKRVCLIEYFGSTYATKQSEKFYAPLDWIIEDEVVEVIGNIYENPELLTQLT